MRAIPTMCNWVKFQNAPNKIYNVPVLVSIWSLLRSYYVSKSLKQRCLPIKWLALRIGALNTEWMIERGGVAAFEELAIQRSRLLYAACLEICHSRLCSRASTIIHKACDDAR